MLPKIFSSFIPIGDKKKSFDVCKQRVWSDSWFIQFPQHRVSFHALWITCFACSIISCCLIESPISCINEWEIGTLLTILIAAGSNFFVTLMSLRYSQLSLSVTRMSLPRQYMPATLRTSLAREHAGSDGLKRNCLYGVCMSTLWLQGLLPMLQFTHKSQRFSGWMGGYLSTVNYSKCEAVGE